MYGSKPSITDRIIQNQKAKVILPSDDQPTSSDNATALIVKYPSKIKINYKGRYFEYFVLKADKKHILEIADSLKFLVNK